MWGGQINPGLTLHMNVNGTHILEFWSSVPFLSFWIATILVAPLSVCC